MPPPNREQRRHNRGSHGSTLSYPHGSMKQDERAPFAPSGPSGVKTTQAQLEPYATGSAEIDIISILTSSDEFGLEGRHHRHFDFSRFETRSEFMDHQHLRDVPAGKLSTWGATIMYFNFMMDINQFFVGYAFANAGYLSGFGVLLGFWTLSLVNQHLLMAVYEQLKTQRGKLVRADMCELVKITLLTSRSHQYRRFAKYSLLIMDIVLSTHMLARMCGLFLDAQNIILMLMQHEGSTHDFYKTQIMLFTPLYVLCLPNELRKHMYVQTAMLALTFILMCLCGVYFFESSEELVKYDAFAPGAKGVFLLMQTGLENFGGINILPYLRNEMANPHNLNRRLGIINIGMFINLAITLVFGFLTMRRFGKYMDPRFGENLRLEESLAQFICVGQIIVGLSSFVLIMYIPVNIFLPRLFRRVKSKNGQLISASVIRAIIIIIIIYTSLLPNILLIVKEFCQFVFCTFLTTFLPPYLYYVIHRHEDVTWKLHVVKVNMALGVLGSILGLITMICLECL